MSILFDLENIEQENLYLFPEDDSLFDVEDENSSKRKDEKTRLFDFNNPFETLLHKRSRKDYNTDFDNEISLLDIFNCTVEDVNIDLSSSIENEINFKREDILQKEITPHLISTIRDEDFEFGYISQSELIIREQLTINALATRNWLNEIFVDYFDDDLILTGILRIIGRFDEKDIFPQGQTMALAALNHKTPEIKELGVRAFENWSSVNSLKILENIDTDIVWLKEYIEQVIIDLTEEVCI